MHMEFVDRHKGQKQHECGAQPCDKPAEEQCDKCKEAAAK